GENMSRFNNGWICIERTIVDSDVFKSDKLFKIWFWLIARANVKPTKIIWRGKQRELDRGQLVTGLREIEEAIGCNRRTVIKWLQYLEDTQRITRERSPRGSVITVLNYKKYQDIREK